jgi:hypothetical protein
MCPALNTPIGESADLASPGTLVLDGRLRRVIADSVAESVADSLAKSVAKFVRGFCNHFQHQDAGKRLIREG